MPRVDAPATDAGYYRGTPPRAGGTGSRRGPKGLTHMAGDGTTAGWQPTVLYLIGLVVAELVAMGVMRYLTKHGG